MTDVIMTVVCMGILSAVLSLFGEENSDLSKYIRFTVSLCFLCALIGGGKKLVSQFDFSFNMPFFTIEYDISSAKENYYEELSKGISQDLEEKLKTNIFENTGIIVKDCSIQLSMTQIGNTTEFSFEKITIITDDANFDLLSEYVLSVCGVSAEIIYES
ncbi:MAG: hypothetical protein E7656_00975 [Ruminococcaceae bacterium]|nr:hypothetical protein [Oscillospiraceae bacterium]